MIFGRERQLWTYFFGGIDFGTSFQGKSKRVEGTRPAEVWQIENVAWPVSGSFQAGFWAIGFGNEPLPCENG